MTHQLFGTRFAKKVDYFAFPRTGSHFLSYLFTGLFDLVFFKIAGQDTAEVTSRSDELEPSVLYTLRLREDGVPFQPLYLDHAPQGIHQQPAMGAARMIILIRDPRPTLYSWMRLHDDRLESPIVHHENWLDDQWLQYQSFYLRAFELAKENPRRTLVLRYEDLVRSSAPLAEVCRFLGLQPKLDPGFVHQLLQFDNVVRKDVERTFYRAGHDRSWVGDGRFEPWLEQLDPASLHPFGYGEASDDLVSVPCSRKETSPALGSPSPAAGKPT